MSKKFSTTIEEAENGSFSAYVPDLPGCVACGETEGEARALIAETVGLHVAPLRRHGEPVPPATSTAGLVSAA